MTEEKSARLSPVAATVLIAVAFVLGAWSAFGREQALQYHDAIVPVLMSLVKWTPFYWFEYRFGMLVPLLALPFRDPFVNFVVQNWLTGFFGFLALLLLPIWLDGRHGWAAGLWSAALVVGVAPAELRFDYLAPSQPYGTALALALGGLLLLEVARERRRPSLYAVAGVALLLGHWVNPTVSLTLLPALLLRHGLGAGLFRGLNAASGAGRLAPLRELGRRAFATLGPDGRVAASALCGCSAVFWLWLKLHGDRASLSFAKAATWLEGLTTLLANLTRDGWGMAWLAAWVLVPLMMIPQRRRFDSAADRHLVEDQRPQDYRPPVALMLAGGLYLLFVATLKWVRVNDYPPRYLLPGLLAIQAGAMMVASRLLASRTRRVEGKVLFGGLGAVLLVIVTALRFGVPTPDLPRQLLAAKFGEATPQIQAFRCTHLVGSYARVWPSVLDARIARADAGDTTPLWGVSFRSQATRELWRATPESEWRLCALVGDPDVDKYRREFDLGGFDVVERGDVVELWRKQ